MGASEQDEVSSIEIERRNLLARVLKPDMGSTRSRAARWLILKTHPIIISLRNDGCRPVTIAMRDAKGSGARHMRTSAYTHQHLFGAAHDRIPVLMVWQ